MRIKLIHVLMVHLIEALVYFQTARADRGEKKKTVCNRMQWDRGEKKLNL